MNVVIKFRQDWKEGNAIIHVSSFCINLGMNIKIWTGKLAVRVTVAVRRGEELGIASGKTFALYAWGPVCEGCEEGVQIQKLSRKGIEES